MYVAPTANRPGLKALRAQAVARHAAAEKVALAQRNAEALAKVAGK